MNFAYPMTKENDRFLTANEIVATLRNSSLPSLLVEGKDDMSAIRALEGLCFEGQLDIFPVNSRFQLFEVFERRSEFSHANVAFLADSDMFVFHGYPKHFGEVIFTDGFSIENDILIGGKAFRILDRRQKTRWNKILSSISRWFASVVHYILEGKALEYACHPTKVVDFSSGTFTAAVDQMILRGDELNPKAREALDDPVKFLRGHSLLDAFAHFLAVAKHECKCSKNVLLRFDLAAWDSNPALMRLTKQIGAKLNLQMSSP